jgi:hypothetical protein
MAELTLPILVVDDYELWRRFFLRCASATTEITGFWRRVRWFRSDSKAQELQPDLISHTSELDCLLSPGKADITRVLRGR